MSLKAQPIATPTADRDADSQAPLPLGLDARLKMGVAPQHLENEPRRQPWGFLDSVRMPPFHGLEGEDCPAAEHDVLVPAAAGVHACQKTQSASSVRNTTSCVDLAREESQVVGHIPASWWQLAPATGEPPEGLECGVAQVAECARPPRLARKLEECALQLLTLP